MEVKFWPLHMGAHTWECIQTHVTCKKEVTWVRLDTHETGYPTEATWDGPNLSIKVRHSLLPVAAS